MGRRKKLNKDQLDVPAKLKEARDGGGMEKHDGLTVFAKSLRTDKQDREGLAVPLARGRFFLELKRRPQDAEMYHAYVNYYNDMAEENYTMEEIMDVAAMRMVLDKFLAFSLQCESAEDASKMKEVHTMVKALWSLLAKYRKTASDREVFSSMQKHKEVLSKYTAITDADYEVLSEKQDEGEEDAKGKDDEQE